MIPSALDPAHPHAQVVRNFLDTLIETRGVEYKQSASFEDLEPHLVKTSMAMANLRGGGYIIVGVAGSSGGLSRTGISASDLATYDADDLLAAINKCASPAVSAIVGTVPHRDRQNSADRNYLVIAIDEFELTPVLCHRDMTWSGKKDRIFAGNIYIRPHGSIATRRPQTATELEEVLDLASLKRAIKIVTSRDTLNAVADAATGASPKTATEAKELGVARYTAELGKAGDL